MTGAGIAVIDSSILPAKTRKVLLEVLPQSNLHLKDLPNVPVPQSATVWMSAAQSEVACQGADGPLRLPGPGKKHNIHPAGFELVLCDQTTEG